MTIGALRRLGPTGRIGKQAFTIDAPKGILLEVEVLIVRRNAGIADKHANSPCCALVRDLLCTRKLGHSALRGT